MGGDGVSTHDLNGSGDDAFALLEQGDGKLVVAGSSEIAGIERFGITRHDSDGALDSSFDDNGIETTEIEVGSDDQVYAVAEAPGGKLVVAGDVTFGGALDFLVMRFNPDGSLDPSFDGDGIVTTDLNGGGADSARAVAVQADGKIIVGGDSGGFSGKDFAVVRYNEDGSLDTDSDADPSTDWSFNGIAIEDLGSTGDRVEALAIQPNGKVLAVGRGDNGFGLARFDEFGDLDEDFDGDSGNGDGSFTTGFGASNTQANDVVISGDSITVAGEAGALLDFALARYDKANGALDTDFGTGGKVITDFAGNPDAAKGIGLQSDGKIVAAGWSNSGSSSGGVDFALARYETDGTLDASFDTDGKVTTGFAGDNGEQAWDMAIQSDGKIIAGGFAEESSNADPRSFALARYDSSGQLDPAFDGDGRVVTEIGISSRGFGLILDSDAKAVLAGAAVDGADDAAVARYETGASATPKRTLDVDLTGDGNGAVTGPGINCPGDCTQEYAEGTEVELTANPTGNSDFAGWSGDCAGSGGCSLTMTGDRSVSAEFGAEPDPGDPDPDPGDPQPDPGDPDPDPADPDPDPGDPGPDEPDPPEEPDFPGIIDPVEVDGVDAFDLELDVTKKGVITATVRASLAGDLVASASTRKKGKRLKYKKRKGSTKPHRGAKLKLKPTRAVKKLLKKSKRPQNFKVKVKYAPDGGQTVYKQSEKIKADVGKSKKIAKWVQVYVGTSTRYRLDSKLGIVVSGTLGFGKAEAVVPANSKVPKKLDALAKRACKDGRPTVELLRQSPTGQVFGSGPVFGRASNTKFSGPSSWTNNIWPALGEDSDEWSVLVRTGWPSGPFGLGGLPNNPKVKFKGKKRTVFCNGSQVSFPHPFVPDPRD